MTISQNLFTLVEFVTFLLVCILILNSVFYLVFDYIAFYYRSSLVVQGKRKRCERSSISTMWNSHVISSYSVNHVTRASRHCGNESAKIGNRS